MQKSQTLDPQNPSLYLATSLDFTGEPNVAVARVIVLAFDSIGNLCACAINAHHCPSPCLDSLAMYLWGSLVINLRPQPALECPPLQQQYMAPFRAIFFESNRIKAPDQSEIAIQTRMLSFAKSLEFMGSGKTMWANVKHHRQEHMKDICIPPMFYFFPLKPTIQFRELCLLSQQSWTTNHWFLCQKDMCGKGWATPPYQNFIGRNMA